jgi:hypothetical protein
MSIPASYIADEVTGKAMMILKTARMATSRLNYTGFVTWADRAQQMLAFNLFNEHSGQGPLLPGLMEGNMRVFNWLMDIAFKDVQVQQLSITDDPAITYGQTT